MSECLLHELTGTGRFFLNPSTICTPQYGYGCETCIQEYKDTGVLDQMIKARSQFLEDVKNNNLGKYYYG